jgi:NADPH-dependent curcumin reductase CurA
VYYDNVGGSTLQAALDAMRTFGRVIMCGSISQYNAKTGDKFGVTNLGHVVAKQLRIEGFLVRRWAAKMPAATAALASLVREGKVAARETVVEGFDRLPHGFLAMLKGDNTGKMVVKV